MASDNAQENEDFVAGYLLGLLAGEGHFGGDGRQPQVTLRMHVRHERMFRWLESRFPGSRLYGPYHHSGRHYFQWMVRGDYLRRVVAPLIAQYRPWLDDHVRRRFDDMCRNYGIDVSDLQQLELDDAGAASGSAQPRTGGTVSEAAVMLPAGEPDPAKQMP